MMYPFLTLDDQTEIVHSQLLDDGSVKVYGAIILKMLLPVIRGKHLFIIRSQYNMARIPVNPGRLIRITTIIGQMRVLTVTAH